MKTPKADLFNDYESLPLKVTNLIDSFEGSNQDYSDCKVLSIALNKIGYTCDYDLSATPYDLFKK
jgi:hypothetical protein